MKLTALCSVLFLAALFVVGPKSLEARHHHRNYFSVNFAPVYSAPQPYLVESYPYVAQRYCVDAWGYPCREAVVVQPAPRVVYSYPRPAVSFGFGWMFR